MRCYKWTILIVILSVHGSFYPIKGLRLEILPSNKKFNESISAAEEISGSTKCEGHFIDKHSSICRIDVKKNEHSFISDEFEPELLTAALNFPYDDCSSKKEKGIFQNAVTEEPKTTSYYNSSFSQSFDSKLSKFDRDIIKDKNNYASFLESYCLCTTTRRAQFHPIIDPEFRKVDLKFPNQEVIDPDLHPVPSNFMPVVLPLTDRIPVKTTVNLVFPLKGEAPDKYSCFTFIKNVENSTGDNKSKSLNVFKLVRPCDIHFIFNKGKFNKSAFPIDNLGLDELSLQQKTRIGHRKKHKYSLVNVGPRKELWESELNDDKENNNNNYNNTVKINKEKIYITSNSGVSRQELTTEPTIYQPYHDFTLSLTNQNELLFNKYIIKNVTYDSSEESKTSTVVISNLKGQMKKPTPRMYVTGKVTKRVGEKKNEPHRALQQLSRKPKINLTMAVKPNLKEIILRTIASRRESTLKL